eukprot:9758412-Alexandrium_andersonii.AAC.1
MKPCAEGAPEAGTEARIAAVLGVVAGVEGLRGAVRARCSGRRGPGTRGLFPLLRPYDVSVVRVSLHR